MKYANIFTIMEYAKHILLENQTKIFPELLTCQVITFLTC